jgi:hypothetical protein
MTHYSYRTLQHVVILLLLSAVFLATSLDRNVSVSLDREEAIKLYANITEGSEKYAIKSVLNTECAFTRAKGNVIQEAVLVNPSNSKVTNTRKYKDVREREYLTSSEIERISKAATDFIR